MTVKMKKIYRGNYFPGDVATFPPAVEAALIKQGAASKVVAESGEPVKEPAKKPEPVKSPSDKSAAPKETK